MISSSKVVITEYENRFLLLYLRDNKAIEIRIIDKNSKDCIGNIYLGEVQNKKDNIESSFINITKNFNVYLKGLSYKNGSIIPVMIKKKTSLNKQDIATDKITIAGIYNVVFENKTIQRTNAKFVDEKSVENEKNYLEDILNSIENYKDKRTKGSLIYKSEHELIKSVFSYRFDEYQDIITDSDSCYEIIIEFLNRYKNLNIDIPKNLIKYNDELISLKALYSIKKHIDEAVLGKVNLKSGAFILFDYTNAFTVIDVNTGSTTFKGTKDEVALLVNKESFDEIMHQMRLRNLSGIIIIDFINLKNKDLYADLEEYINQKIKEDNRKAKNYGFTKLGLLEITRDRVDPPLHELIKIK